jgi:hypothetical protein
VSKSVCGRECADKALLSTIFIRIRSDSLLLSSVFRKMPILSMLKFVNDYKVKPPSFVHLSRLQPSSQWIAGFFARGKAARA